MEEDGRVQSQFSLALILDLIWKEPKLKSLGNKIKVFCCSRDEKADGYLSLK